MLVMSNFLVVQSHAEPHITVSSQASPKISFLQNLKELKHFILSEHDNIFGNHLQKFNETVMMYFCQSCLRFKEAYFPTDIDRINAAGSVYER